MIRDEGFKIKDASQKLQIRYENAKFIYRTYLKENRSDKIDTRERKMKKYNLRNKRKRVTQEEGNLKMSSKYEVAMAD